MILTSSDPTHKASVKRRLMAELRLLGGGVAVGETKQF
jgi:hypothetical protein